MGGNHKDYYWKTVTQPEQKFKSQIIENGCGQSGEIQTMSVIHDPVIITVH